MSVVNASALLASAGGDYQIQRSVRLRSSATAFFSRTPSVAGNQQRHTASFWIKYSTSSSDRQIISFGNSLTYQIAFGNGGTTLSIGSQQLGVSNPWFLGTTQVFRDPSAWYHIVVAVDTTQATASERAKIYVNGVQVTAFSTATYPTQNYNTGANSTTSHSIGRREDASQYFDGYLTEFNWIDGQALTAFSFGETDAITGVWKPKRYGGTYGVNGFYLNFSDNSAATAAAIGKDSSGNGNNWTPNNISLTAGATYDSMLDVPTLWADGGNGRGNYAVLNPLYRPSTQNPMSFRNANLEVGQASTNLVSSAASAFAMSSGKWYWEVTVGGALTVSALGIQREDNTAWRGGGTVLYRSDGQKQIGGGAASAYGATFTTNDVLGFAYDADAGSLTCYKNNVSQGVIYSSGTGSAWMACAHDDNAGAGVTYFHAFNFGQRPFAYTPPTGFRALHTGNLPEPSIRKPNQWFDVRTRTGTSTATTISGYAFTPDLVWIKIRSGNERHVINDTVRGAQKQLASNTTAAEDTSATGALTAFTSDGYSLDSDLSRGSVNNAAYTYVDWLWKKGATPGFDIVGYSGNGASNRTVSHSLGVTPAMVIVKNRTSGTPNWRVWHQRLSGVDSFLGLNQTAAVGTSSTVFNGFSSTTFTVGTDPATNENGSSHVAYLFSEVAGFSRFGSYTGNGSSDGPFVFCGFRPRFILLKRTDSAGNWTMYDSARSPRNADTKVLYPNLSNSEDASTDHFDWLSNGFKMKSTNQNTSGGTFIFAAFAENPFKYSLAQ